MIKVIKSGKYGNIYKITCNKCRCEFSYEYKDTSRDSPNYYSDDCLRYVECPECLKRLRATFIEKDKKEHKKEEV